MQFFKFLFFFNIIKQPTRKPFLFNYKCINSDKSPPLSEIQKSHTVDQSNFKFQIF